MCDKLIKKSKRSFSEAWLSDDRVKSWIRKISFDDSLYHCIICNKNISCNTHVLRHADSASHKNNIKESTSSLLNNENKNSNKSVKDKFRQQWLDIELFKPWLREVSHDIHSFFCSFCDKSMVGGLTQIYRHAESKAHIKIFEKKIGTKNTEDINIMDDPVLSFDERKKSAEIRFAALIADKNIPHQTAKDILSLFQEVGKDYNILKNMSIGRTKCTNIISNVLCTVETNRVVNSIQNTKFSIFIDETSDICNEKWMTFLVTSRYVDPESLDIRTQLVKLINIDAKNSSAEKLFHAFKCEMWKLQIPFLNIIALSCDNASVMIGKHLSFKKKLEELCKNLLTFPCPCHSAALVAHAACAKIPEYCEEFVKKIASYINSSPKRAAIYQEFCECFQETSRKILKLSDTRWLSHHACVERLLEYWDTIKLFLTEMVVCEKSKSGEHLLSIMNNPDLKGYLLFLKYILNFLNSFNAFFQALETRVHLLQPKSVNFLTTVSKQFLKPELLKNVCNNFQFYQKENQKNINTINLGSECEEYLDQLIKEGHADVIANVRENCLQFYVIAAEEISKRLPINDQFLLKLKVFLPENALYNNDRKTSFNDVSFIAQTLGGFDENELQKEWYSLHLDFTETEKEHFSILNFDEMWKEILLSLNQLQKFKYPNLKSLLNAVRSLPNSNADPERTFSFLSDIKTKKRNKLSATSINAICVFKSALKARKETVLNMEINEQHLSLMSSDKLYANNNPKKKNNNLTLYAADITDTNSPSSANDM